MCRLGSRVGVLGACLGEHAWCRARLSAAWCCWALALGALGLVAMSANLMTQMVGAAGQLPQKPTFMHAGGCLWLAFFACSRLSWWRMQNSRVAGRA